MTGAERRLGLALRSGAIAFAALALSYIGMGLFGDAEFPFVANSTAKDGLFAAVALIGAGNPRRHTWAPVVISLGHAIIAFCPLAATLQGPLLPDDGTLVLVGWALAATAVAIAFWWLRRAALREHHGLRYPDRGREVLVVERGPHVDPTQFSRDEATQLARLYRDGALTLSRDFRFQVLQGMCVGGTTVVNNAVCFDIPPGILSRWNGDEYEAGLDERRLRASFAHLAEELPPDHGPGQRPRQPRGGRVPRGPARPRARPPAVQVGPDRCEPQRLPRLRLLQLRLCVRQLRPRTAS